MSFVCEICGKRPLKGNKIVRRGKPKKKGGVGLKTTGINKVRRKPNLRHIRIVLPSGQVRRARVCMACLRSDKVKKAV